MNGKRITTTIKRRILGHSHALSSHQLQGTEKSPNRGCGIMGHLFSAREKIFFHESNSRTVASLGHYLQRFQFAVCPLAFKSSVSPARGFPLSREPDRISETLMKVRPESKSLVSLISAASARTTRIPSAIGSRKMMSKFLRKGAAIVADGMGGYEGARKPATWRLKPCLRFTATRTATIRNSIE